MPVVGVRPSSGRCGALGRGAVLLPRSYVVAVQRAGGAGGDAAARPARGGGAGPGPRPARRAASSPAGPTSTRRCTAPRRTPTRRAPPDRATPSRPRSRAARSSATCRVLGICRGMQLHQRGRSAGTLLQHLPDRLGHEEHRPLPGAFVEHEVRLRARLARGARGRRRAAPTSSRTTTRAPDRLGQGLVATGWALDDGTVEALEAAGAALRPGRALAPGGGRGQPGRGCAGRGAAARRAGAGGRVAR